MHISFSPIKTVFIVLLTFSLLTGCGAEAPDGSATTADNAGGDNASGMGSGGSVPDVTGGTPEPTEKGQCTVDTDCEVDSYCAGATDTSTGRCMRGCRTTGLGCETGQVCTDEHRCVTPPCTVDAQCPSDEYCADNGDCTKGCRLIAGACPGETPSACDPVTRTCLALVRCCPSGESCRDELPSMCPEQACSDAQPCPGNQRCSENGQCIEATECSEDADCLGDRRCIGQICTEPCTENAQCSGSDVCEAGRCVAPPECRADGDCGLGQRCQDDRCVNACDAMGQCPAGFQCSSDNTCVPQVQCMNDDECPNGRCVDGQCTTPCGEDRLCPEGERCNENSQCEPDICQDDADCEGAQYCERLTGECLEPCIGNESCPNTQICDPQSSRCIDPVACESDLDCPRGEACGDNGLCAEPPECLVDLQCGQNGICVDNECQPGCTAPDGARACLGEQLCNPDTLRCQPNQCAGDFECPTSFICNEDNQCEPGCSLTQVCPGNRQCDQNTGRCPELSASCQALLDCDAPRICDCAARGDCDETGGRCQNPCQNDVECQANDRHSLCNVQTGLCEVDPNACDGLGDDARCGNGRICTNAGRCIDGCQDNADCPAGEVCLDNRQCGLEPQCRDDNGCDAGFRCNDQGNCINSCTESGDCPAGYICSDEQRCEQDLTCADDADCVGIDETVCIENTCTPRCLDNAACPGAQVCLLATGRCIDGCVDDFACPGQVCNPATAQCEDAPRCQNDDDGICGADEICVNQECVLGCTQNPTLCAADERCDAQTNRCAPRLCGDRDDCEAGEICAEGRCAPGCGMLGGPICPGNRVCDPGTGLCPELSNDCRRPEDCNEGRVCDCLANGGDCFIGGGACIESCGPNAPCERGVCDADGSGFCVNPGLCQNDADCIEGSICSDGRCAESCETIPCPGTRICDLETGRCPQPEACFSDDDCDDPSRCNIATNKCVEACNGADPCGDGLICDDQLLLCRGCEGVFDCPNDRWSCDAQTGACVAPATCFENVDCAQGEVCDVVTGACVAACGNNDDCPGNQICDANSICVENAAGCNVAIDCIRDRVCADGACAEPCQNDDTCPGQQLCSIDSGLCREAAGGACNDALDCLGDRVCSEGVCRDQDCVTNSDCAGVCIDFVCVDRPLQDCFDNADCDAGQDCSPFGVCVRTAPNCTEDVECPAGTPYCRSGECVPCTIDDECGTGYACKGDRCIYQPPATCVLDNDCGGSQLCTDDGAGLFVCQPGLCDGDAFDLADDTEVVARTYTGLVLCDGDEDVYRYALQANEGLEVVIRHDANQADLALEIRDGQAVLGRVDGPFGVEALSVLPNEQARDLTIAVFGRAGTSASYDLGIRSLGANECSTDQYEGVLGNDDQSNAMPIGAEVHTMNVCAGDSDWLRLDATAGTDLTVTVTGLVNGVTAQLVHQAGQATPLADQVALTKSVLADESYFVQLSNDGNENHALTVSVEANAAVNASQTACNAAAELVADVAAPLVEQLYVKRFSLSCAPDDVGQTQEHIFTFTLDQASLVSLDVDGVFFGALTIQSGCNLTQADDPCSYVGPAENNSVQDVPLAPGQYFVVIHSLPKQRPTVTLRVQNAP